jgi:hypothetical protein
MAKVMRHEARRDLLRRRSGCIVVFHRPRRAAELKREEPEPKIEPWEEEALDHTL